MITNLDPGEICNLIRDTAALYVTSPDELSVKHQESEKRSESDFGGIIFGVKCSQSDEGRLIGRDGSHAAALGRIVRSLGVRAGVNYQMMILSGRRTDGAWVPPGQVIGWDSETAVKVLDRWLKALAVPDPKVEVVGPVRHSGSLEYKVLIKTGASYDHLIINDAKDDPSGLSIVGALGTIFRAIGRQAGNVRVRIEAA